MTILFVECSVVLADIFKSIIGLICIMHKNCHKESAKILLWSRIRTLGIFAPGGGNAKQ